MKYNYEMLCEKQFQKFAYSLLINEFSNLQSLPVGQPDGGRDGFAYDSDQEKAGFTVFQVKYSLNPSAKSERDAIQEIIKTEKTKVEKLVAKGANRYLLVTNIAGTAHFENGAIDKTNELLTKEFSIPTQVIWRDDLDTRLDNNPHIKSSFPQICNMIDFLEQFLNSSDPIKSKSSARTIKGFISTQFTKNENVKFKQVDLSKDLFDLFIDVPLRMKGAESLKKSYRTRPDEQSRHSPLEEYLAGMFLKPENAEPTFAKAADFLLKMPIKCEIGRLVLEGGPGQGKSTVTQYFCQLHRLRFLDPKRFKRFSESNEHLDAFSARIPIQVDLRDFASWLNGVHPFDANNSNMLPSSGKRSLEGFLAMLISWDSSGSDVDEDELTDLFENADILIALDGFDEVADVETRKKLVDEVHIASNRIGLHAKSLQIIVTSRPAAFANSPGFSKEHWTHLELKDLGEDDIFAYKDKWMSAQDLDSTEMASITSTLKQKLNQSHIRDLARSPMQLAILLHLIHAQGPALPDKRTALYNKYINLFFDRESEKSNAVRDYRDLLMSIHGYLGWVLQTRSEMGTGSGRITKKDFSTLVRSYLENEGYNEEGLADRLLTGIEQRVVALVARVEGTLEFEVQPLREYFTAYYLYDSAPHSALGKEKLGTRPERFDALARNNYWSNVTRFYCGFYGKGELSSLVDGIIHLSDGGDHGLINGPRELALTLLSDWVFAQSPKDTKKIIDFIVQEQPFRRLTIFNPGSSIEQLRLPERAGRAEMVARCKSLLDFRLKSKIDASLHRVILSNSSPIEKRQHVLEWLRNEFKMGSLNWRTLGISLSNVLTKSDVIGLAQGVPMKEVEGLFETGLIEDVFLNDGYKNEIVSYLGDGHYRPMRKRGNLANTLETALNMLVNFIHPHVFRGIIGFPHEEADTVLEIVSSRYYVGGYTSDDLKKFSRSTPEEGEHSIIAFARSIISYFELPISEWQSNVSIWKEFSNLGLNQKFSTKNFVAIALIGSTLIESDDNYESTDGFWVPESGLLSRFLFAKANAHDLDWWLGNPPNVNSTMEKEIYLLALNSCSNVALLSSLHDSIRPLFSQIDGISLSTLHYNRCSPIDVTPDNLEVLESLLAKLDMDTIHDQRFCCWLLTSFEDDVRISDFLSKAFCGRTIFDEFVRQQLVNREVSGIGNSPINWNYLKDISLQQADDEDYSFGIWHQAHGIDKDLPIDVAREVVLDTQNHSNWLLAVSERRISAHVATTVMPLETVSEEGEWFFS